VDQRLGVHDDVDAVERDVEQQVGLDDLEALVDQGRGVDRDDRPHVPGGMGEGLLDRDVGELGPRPAAERPTTGRKHQATYLAVAAAA